MGIKILHISDLHISSNEDNNYEILRKGILDWIRDNNIKIDIIAFTGDIIDKNDTNAFEKAIDFFEKLLEICDLSKERLLIVPGNHDIERNSIVEMMLEAEKLNSDNYVKDNWKYIKVRMNAYAEFVKKLGIEEESLQEGFGVRTIQIGDKVICFNLLNSAWSSKGNEDYRNLFIGRWQLEENRKKIAELDNKDLVITMLHHPISWFTDEESNLLKDYLCHNDKFKSSVVLHGHIHDSKTQRETFPNGGFTSLITGIGYPRREEREAQQPKICECKFSVYDLDIEKNSVDNYCLMSTQQGSFVPDTSLYAGSKDGHYTIEIANTKAKKIEEQESECMELDPVPVINCWSGRKEELDLLSKDKTSVIAISGVGGQGKTALAAKFMRETPENAKKFNKKVWVDCRELPNTMHYKLLNLLEAMTGGKESAATYKDEQLSDTIKRFFKHISEEKVLIVFDNVDAYVNLESEEIFGELSEFVEVALTQQHDSLLILTCRIPVYDSRANFRTIKLDGLKEPEGIDFLRNRGVNIEKSEDEIACKQIIRITKGHPWWLGLIAGQMISENVSPIEYLNENRDGILARDSQVERFFGAIWEKLNTSTGRIAQNIIRYLAETNRPLTVEDFSLLLDENHKNVSKAVKLLNKMNLLIAHGEKEGREKSFQVHPLVREFIHKNYDNTVQKPFVDKLLRMIIGNRLYTIIFVNTPNTVPGKIEQWNSTDIIDSIETCLTSRNATDALTIISSTYQILINDGHHEEFLSLGERVLDNVDWKKEEIAINKNRAAFLSQYLDLFVLQEQSKPKVDFYLKKYESGCEKNTIPYSGYAGTKAFVLWRSEKYSEALQWLREYEDIQERTNEVWEFSDMKNLKGIILREMGDVEAALEVLRELPESSAKHGNIARCYQMKSEYDLALHELRLCLRVLRIDDNSFADYVNLGYAYWWIAETYNFLDEKSKAKKYLLLCQEIWKEYAPNLLSKTVDLFEKLGGVEIKLDDLEIEHMIEEFLEEMEN